MWFRFRFTIFGREIWSFELDRDEGFDFFEEEDDSDDEEESEDDEEEDGEEVLRWGEPCSFVRDVFVP